MRIDPAIVATVSVDPVATKTLESIPDREDVPHASDDIAVPFGA